MNHALILAEKLALEHDLSDVELLELLESRDSKTALFLCKTKNFMYKILGFQLSHRPCLAPHVRMVYCRMVMGPQQARRQRIPAIVPKKFPASWTNRKRGISLFFNQLVQADAEGN